MYHCVYCDKSLSSQAQLDYHVTKKVCRKPEKVCPTCGQVFFSKRTCQYHISHQVCLNIAPKPKLQLTKKALYSQLTHEELVERLCQTETKYETLKENPQNVNVQQNIQNNLIFPSSFGQEDIEHIKEKMGDIIGPLIRGGDSYIPMLAEKIHNSQKMPEPCLSQRLLNQ